VVAPLLFRILLISVLGVVATYIGCESASAADPLSYKDQRLLDTVHFHEIAMRLEEDEIPMFFGKIMVMSPLGHLCVCSGWKQSLY
jgi:hypothetical protein